MSPVPGERLQRFVGDRVRFRLEFADAVPSGTWRAFLRTNLGRGRQLRQEILTAHFGKLPLAGASWRDVPMIPAGSAWEVELSLAEVGFFKAKAYAIDAQGLQYWPAGPDFGLSVHPDFSRTANTIYCAFPRLFGATRTELSTQNDPQEKQFQTLDQDGFTVIPPSGKLRDLTRHLDHIFDTLGCRILHLLPVNPTPTSYARYGRFGSPYAAQNLAAIDLALVEFDRRTTGVQQFEELAYAVHARNGRLFLDIVINHTGWGSNLQEDFPHWFLREESGDFVSPGAWGTIWEDLAELDHRFPELWDYLADVFLTWCRRGVDGFRCDAGYKVPAPAWQYIIAKVQEEFPETIFLLEGLGGAWEATEKLLTEGGMQWAYSELFQNHSPVEISGYLTHALRQSPRVGTLVHYSETHDNDRLAKKGRAWSLARNQICALASHHGGFAFTCGVEWLATEKIRVHGCTGLGWGRSENIVQELRQLNWLLTHHPAFFDGATLQRISADNDPVLALLRVSAEGKDRVLLLINTDAKTPHDVIIPEKIFHEASHPQLDLLTGKTIHHSRQPQQILFRLLPAESLCLSCSLHPTGLAGDAYRQQRALAAWAIQAIHTRFSVRDIGPYSWQKLAALVEKSPQLALAGISRMEIPSSQDDWLTRLSAAAGSNEYAPVVTWRLADRSRILSVPPDHWLLIEDEIPFRATLEISTEETPLHLQSIRCGQRHIACIAPRQMAASANLSMERYQASARQVRATLCFLQIPHWPESSEMPITPFIPELQIQSLRESNLILLTNGRGGMSRIRANLGTIESKYDCLLGANLHAALPVDRHVFIKRLRAWINAAGFISPLNADNLLEFIPGPPASWRFLASAGDGRSVEIQLTIDMLQDENTVAILFRRSDQPPSAGRALTHQDDVRLTVRFDIEDRNFHSETKHNDGANQHFTTHTRALSSPAGFSFTPAHDRHLRVTASRGDYHHQPEWCFNLPHPVEQSRGQEAAGDAYSPGWFDLPLAAAGESVFLTATAEKSTRAEASNFIGQREALTQKIIGQSAIDDPFGRALARACDAFVVKRDRWKTVIAGYPWFLDWGRDSLIFARGLLAAGGIDDVLHLLTVFGRFEQTGTLPNTIHGEDATNRNTTDAPLWYGIVCEDAAEKIGPELYQRHVEGQPRTLLDVLQSIALGYIRGTHNGIHMDPETGLIWSPAHYTWMDTNYPAGTPRQGYPVEIQVLWIRLLRQLAKHSHLKTQDWSALAEKTHQNFLKLFWNDSHHYLADCLVAGKGTSAAHGTWDDALRSNYLFAISLGILDGDRARKAVQAATDWLIVPGALRTLAPRPVELPLAVHSASGHLLNNPYEPYWARYEGDEDTRRKPAYHNGTAWCWTFPTYCEALAKAFDFSEPAVAAARAYLYGMNDLLKVGCLGHLPEIVDGDAPHHQRGCDAQAWSVSEALRVWKMLGGRPQVVNGKR